MSRKPGRKNTCSICKNIKEFESKRYCNSCHSAYMREWRKTHPLSTEQKIKSSCRSKLNVNIKRGKVFKKPCEICGISDVQAHHHDYTKPYDVNWFCRKHHLELHHAS